MSIEKFCTCKSINAALIKRTDQKPIRFDTFRVRFVLALQCIVHKREPNKNSDVFQSKASDKTRLIRYALCSVYILCSLLILLNSDVSEKNKHRFTVPVTDAIKINTKVSYWFGYAKIFERFQAKICNLQIYSVLSVFPFAISASQPQLPLMKIFIFLPISNIT